MTEIRKRIFLLLSFKIKATFFSKIGFVKNVLDGQNFNLLTLHMKINKDGAYERLLDMNP